MFKLAVWKNGKPYCIMHIYFCFELYLLWRRYFYLLKSFTVVYFGWFSHQSQNFETGGVIAAEFISRVRFFYHKYLMLALTGFLLDHGWKLEQNYFFHYVYSQTKFFNNVIKIVSNAIKTLPYLQILKRCNIYMYI